MPLDTKRFRASNNVEDRRDELPYRGKPDLKPNEYLDTTTTDLPMRKTRKVDPEEALKKTGNY